MSIRLVDSRLCADCAVVYDDTVDKACPKCGGVYFVRLAPILNREEAAHGTVQILV